MKICIVNPGRCGSTVVLASLANKLDNFSMIYDEISEFVFNEDSEYELILKNGRTTIFLGSQNLQLKIK